MNGMLKQSGAQVLEYVRASLNGRGATDSAKIRGAVVLSQYVAIEHKLGYRVESVADAFGAVGDEERKHISTVISQARTALEVLNLKGQNEIINSWFHGELPIRNLQTRRGMENLPISCYNAKKWFGDVAKVSQKRFARFIREYVKQEGQEATESLFNSVMYGVEEVEVEEVEVMAF